MLYGCIWFDVFFQNIWNELESKLSKIWLGHEISTTEQLVQLCNVALPLQNGVLHCITAQVFVREFRVCINRKRQKIRKQYAICNILHSCIVFQMLKSLYSGNGKLQLSISVVSIKSIYQPMHRPPFL